MIALTGTPLINDIEDFLRDLAVPGLDRRQEPLAELMDALEDTGLTPADNGSSGRARRA